MDTYENCDSAVSVRITVAELSSSLYHACLSLSFVLKALVEEFHKIEWSLIDFYVSHCKKLNNKLKNLSFCIFFPAINKLYHKRVIYLSYSIKLLIVAKMIPCMFFKKL